MQVGKATPGQGGFGRALSTIVAEQRVDPA